MHKESGNISLLWLWMLWALGGAILRRDGDATDELRRHISLAYDQGDMKVDAGTEIQTIETERVHRTHNNLILMKPALIIPA